ncbi:unnamed protein product [Caenorhabditis auriculariae]|uniref:Uncharacterized protein n=1 Tax=Caenorhabditis auriculariae TaxID=2777116 RepID=A0A8S1GPZ7_9PELO|nr:unnamed protein product [Caenorhabditis auriculariae]
MAERPRAAPSVSRAHRRVAVRVPSPPAWSPPKDLHSPTDMDAGNDLLPLLPEVQDALSEEFDGIECSMGPGVVLAQAPFRLPFAHLGRQVTFVPDTSCLEDFECAGMHRIDLGKKSAIFTDGEPGCCLELVLGRGRDWITPLTKLFDKLYPVKWAFFVAELEQGHATYHVLSSSLPAVSSTKREDTPDSTEQSSMISSPSASVSEASNFSLWVVPVTKIFAVPAPKKTVKVVRKVIKKKSPTGEVIVDPGEPPKERKVRIVKKKAEKKDSPDRETGTPTARSSSSELPLNGSIGLNKVKSVNSSDSLDGDVTPVNGSFTACTSADMPDSDGSASELRRKLLANTSSENFEEKFLVNGEPRKLNGFSSAQRALRPSLSRSSMTPDRRLDPIFEGKSSERLPPPTITTTKPQNCRITHPSPAQIPVVALQMILTKCFSYQQLGYLRGYYKLLERSDKLLMSLQRRVVAEPALQYATSVMTNIQVHILNPVDIMRAVLDEGVCCFPYGIILDKTFLLLDRIESMLKGNYEETVNWEPVATHAKRAALHYRTHLERVMEERMGENLRLKAAQRIIRLDSFMVDAQVSKLEKEASKAKEDLRWEIEQLHQKNSQLRRENRELKASQMKLESRVEILEGKFKTLARLLS